MLTGKLKRHLLFWTLAVGLALLDLASKQLAFSRLTEGARPVEVLGQVLMLRIAHNTGTFFGLGSGGAGSNTALTVFTVLMMALVLYMYLLPPKEAAGRTLLYTLALGLVFAGAGANLYDRVCITYVRDFIDVGIRGHRWPTFNLADVWLTVGIAVYLLALLRMGRRPAAGPPAAPAAGGGEGGGQAHG
jgi:signal peptidase II